MMKKTNTQIVLFSVLLILTGFAVAVVANQFIGEWAFIPLALVYWSSIFIIVKPTKKKISMMWRPPILT